MKRLMTMAVLASCTIMTIGCKRESVDPLLTTEVVTTKNITSEDAKVAISGMLTPGKGAVVVKGQHQLQITDYKPAIETMKAALQINDQQVSPTFAN